MFQIDEDLTIHITRGDIAFFTVHADDDGNPYTFKVGDIVRMKVCAKKDCTNIAFQKDFPVLEETETVDLILNEEETKIGEVISKPVDYWYEIELNPYTNPQTIIGYDEDGAKIFKLYPEGKDLGKDPVEPEKIPVVDEELSLESTRPVENQAITRAMTKLSEDVKEAVESNSTAIAGMEKKVTDTKSKVTKDLQKLDQEISVERQRINGILSLKEGSTTGDAELMDIRIGYDTHVYGSAGDAVRMQFQSLYNLIVSSTGGDGDSGSNEGAVSSEEVIDIRKGYDGKVYTTAGEAVRTQVSGLDKRLDSILTTYDGVKYDNEGDAVRAQAQALSDRIDELKNYVYGDLLGGES